MARLFPYLAHAAGLEITNLELVVLAKNPGGWPDVEVTVTTGSDAQTATLIGSAALFGGQPSASIAYARGMAPGTWDVSVPVDQLGTPADWADDLIIIVTYQLDLALG